MSKQLITILTSGIFAAGAFSCMAAMMLGVQATTMAEGLISMGAPLPPQPETVATLEQIELSRPFAERTIVPALQWSSRSVG